eukprot:TRINITY_DN15157_c1_g1_i2.p1 TRINITY_DN15157_c1_g1~~TRINITY_DN15157_c1_g1_i2.p1  ORF type:complete len:710 (+),score=247.71 TRINITY_DN15157_c1_g1_i2:74-2203(+)
MLLLPRAPAAGACAASPLLLQRRQLLRRAFRAHQALLLAAAGRGRARCPRRHFVGHASDTESLRRLGTAASTPAPAPAAPDGGASVGSADRWNERNEASSRGSRSSDTNYGGTALGQTTVIKVRSETKTASLSGWLTTRLRESKDPIIMTTIGAKGINQIIKAISVAHELLHEEGELLCRVTHTHTITDDGSPASYFAVTVRPVPPRGDNAWRGQAPNRVGKTSHVPTMQQMAQTAQKTGQVCTFAVAGPETTIKAVLTIASLGQHAQFSPCLVKNEEGEYTAIHLRILPPPGAPKTIFVSKFTKPAKLAGYIKFTFTAEDGPRRVRLVASADAHDAVRAMLKACEYASDYLDQDRMPISMTSELAEDSDAISAGSFIVTLSRDISKESTATKVTVGLGNLESERIAGQVRQGLDSGKLVLLRTTLQGTVPSLEALSKLNETYPIIFYSKPKDVQYGDIVDQQRGSAAEDAVRNHPDRFYLELFVERTPTPAVIQIPQTGRTYVPYKVDGCVGALKVHKKATVRVLSHEGGASALRIVAMTNNQFQESNPDKVVQFSTTIHQLGFELSLVAVEPYEELRKWSHAPKSVEVHLRNRDTRDLKKASELAEEAVGRARKGQWTVFAANSHDNMLLVLRALGHAKLPAVARQQSHSSVQGRAQGVDVFLPPMPAEGAAADPDEFPLGPGEEDPAAAEKAGGAPEGGAAAQDNF